MRCSCRRCSDLSSPAPGRSAKPSARPCAGSVSGIALTRSHRSSVSTQSSPRHGCGGRGGPSPRRTADQGRGSPVHGGRARRMLTAPPDLNTRSQSCQQTEPPRRTCPRCRIPRQPATHPRRPGCTRPLATCSRQPGSPACIAGLSLAGPPGPPARPREVILMIVSRHSPATSPGGRRPVLWRVVGAVARALRHVHREQALMWDCWSRANRVPVHRDGPLAWEPTLDGPRLIGRHLPAPDNANPGGTR